MRGNGGNAGIAHRLASLRCCADASVEEPARAAASASALSCAALGWEYRLDTTAVCAASEINGDCHKRNTDFVHAQETCAGVGARLCSMDELTSGAARGTGCGIDVHATWSSDACFGFGHYTVTGDGRSNPDASELLSCARDSAVRSARCCADRGVARRAVSRLPCVVLEQLPDRFVYRQGSTSVCAGSVVNGDCTQRASFLEATAICEDVGARLCSTEELEGDLAKGTGCSLDYRQVWTSTVCEDATGYFSAIGIATGGTPICRTDVTTRLGVRCCGDVHVI